jgi:hypothetical protein
VLILRFYFTSHGHRVLPVANRKNCQKIDFPAASAKVWKDVEAELGDVLPHLFTHVKFKQGTVDDASRRLDEWLYGYFKEKFGIRAVQGGQRGAIRKVRPHKGMEALRRQKNQCRAALKALERAGLGRSEEARVLAERWKGLLRQHNRLRRRVGEAKKKKEAVAAQRRFRKDPHAFASKFYDRSGKGGAPSFTKETAQDYFTHTYTDKGRSHKYVPSDSMERPEMPMVEFNCRGPTLKELRRSVRRKRNGACPGLNALPYLIYKKCPSVLAALHRLILRVWREQEIPSRWGRAFIILLSKSEVLDNPAEFRPIAIAATDGKIFFSVVSDRLQKYLCATSTFVRRCRRVS